MNQSTKLAVCAACIFALSTSVFGKDKDKDKDSLSVKLRYVERTLVLAPGESGEVASACASGEAVVGGSPLAIPAKVTVVASNLFYDGIGSGWAIEWKNNGTETVTVTPGTGALCVKGEITLIQ